MKRETFFMSIIIRLAMCSRCYVGFFVLNSSSLRRDGRFFLLKSRNFAVNEKGMLTVLLMEKRLMLFVEIRMGNTPLYP